MAFAWAGPAHSPPMVAPAGLGPPHTFRVSSMARNFRWSPSSMALLMMGSSLFTASSRGTGGTFSPPAVMISSGEARPGPPRALFQGPEQQAAPTDTGQAQRRPLSSSQEGAPCPRKVLPPGGGRGGQRTKLGQGSHSAHHPRLPAEASHLPSPSARLSPQQAFPLSPCPAGLYVPHPPDGTHQVPGAVLVLCPQ